jgi:hypothetical protein
MYQHQNGNERKAASIPVIDAGAEIAHQELAPRVHDGSGKFSLEEYRQGVRDIRFRLDRLGLQPEEILSSIAEGERSARQVHAKKKANERKADNQITGAVQPNGNGAHLIPAGAADPLSFTGHHVPEAYAPVTVAAQELNGFLRKAGAVAAVSLIITGAVLYHNARER